VRDLTTQRPGSRLRGADGTSSSWRRSSPTAPWRWPSGRNSDEQIDGSLLSQALPSSPPSTYRDLVALPQAEPSANHLLLDLTNQSPSPTAPDLTVGPRLAASTALKETSDHYRYVCADRAVSTPADLELLYALRESGHSAWRFPKCARRTPRAAAAKVRSCPDKARNAYDAL